MAIHRKNGKNRLHLGGDWYVDTQFSKYSPNKRLPNPGLILAAHAILKELGINRYPTKAEYDSMTGKSTQVPTGRVIGVKTKDLSRCPKLTRNNVTITYTDNIVEVKEITD